MQGLIEKLREQSPRPFDIVGLGECSIDWVYELPGRLRELAGGKWTAVTFETLGGGQVATALCAAARLGRKTAFLGAVGDDQAGAAVLSGLRGFGVDTTDAVIVAGAATRTALLLVDRDGERTVIERRDPKLRVADGEKAAAAAVSARFLHLDGIYPDMALQVARSAKRHGTLISIDFDAGDAVPPRDAVAMELLALADLCVVPAGFATALTHKEDLQAAALATSRLTRGQVIVTLGAGGSLAVADERLRHQPALSPPAGVRDTTACGDTFRAALIVYLLEYADQDGAAMAPPFGQDLLTLALRFASATAALKCQGRGRTGCPTRSAVAEFLSSLGANR
jgi:sugar/nucleoside kinase (ribokinase family)